MESPEDAGCNLRDGDVHILMRTRKDGQVYTVSRVVKHEEFCHLALPDVGALVVQIGMSLYREITGGILGRHKK